MILSYLSASKMADCTLTSLFRVAAFLRTIKGADSHDPGQLDFSSKGLLAPVE